ncbi:Zinc transporter ZIP13 [Echinococcus granulosus]|uniref:Zinc transporter ZIP13 n=1 Tax=Echinococcus granulosus TaxID=6210 RepID=W6URA1_ECHGR|nr:Zinc transporter ZIP13 [Echinococcus granulosus]EUB60847.1 Zinc transporter ZIP13 [Echinococcus granulosus]
MDEALLLFDPGTVTCSSKFGNVEMVGLPNFFEAILSTLSAMAVGSSGIFPALILEAPNKLSLNEIGMNCGDSISTLEIVLNRWLCFATGSLLGEVFLHLLPESVDSLLLSSSAWALAILTGILVFFATEMVAGFYENLQAVGYLNLLANSIDNFSHGLSLGASYSVSIRCGLIATTCLLIHEIPHEISDFIILLRSGFSRRGAIKAQLLTASTCLIGTYTLAIFRWKFKGRLDVIAAFYGRWVSVHRAGLFTSHFFARKDTKGVLHPAVLHVAWSGVHSGTCMRPLFELESSDRDESILETISSSGQFVQSSAFVPARMIVIVVFVFYHPDSFPIKHQ